MVGMKGDGCAVSFWLSPLGVFRPVWRIFRPQSSPQWRPEVVWRTKEPGRPSRRWSCRNLPLERPLEANPVILSLDSVYRYLPRWVGGGAVLMCVTNTYASPQCPGEVGGQREIG
jgi:hypothetical protein